ncbi:MAG: hypothetical protein HY273_13080 [Gammaproteobacteria bacterium]|nr:hypothetical protein [Gammaproteobacteria bacterium]
MQRIATEHDSSLRAVKSGNDELGVLAEGFNSMLDEIGKRRAELENAQDQLRHHLMELNNEVAERKRAQTSIRLLNEDLERRVKERTAQLELSNKELEAFAYSVSHDLRAPLRGIDGFSNILLSEHSASLNPTGQLMLQRVRTAAQRMGTLIDDLLKLSRITRAQLNHEDVDLGASWGDRNLLAIVFDNLLGNAWKFTSKNEDPQVELGIDTHDAVPAYFVRDNGAGFDMAHVGQLFNPFQRLHNANEFPGTGIGLATVHRAIKKHGGNIWAEAHVGKGATIYFTLPPPAEAAEVSDEHTIA